MSSSPPPSRLPRIAVLSPSFAKSAALLQELGGLGAPLAVHGTSEVLAGAALIDFLRQAQAEVAVVGREIIDGAVLDACPTLRFVAKYGVGLDNIDEPALAERSVGLGWTAGVNKRAVAELVLAFALGHCRNVVPAIEAMRQGVWHKDGGRELGGLTVGIVGLGHTGSEVARLFGTFGCRLLYAEIADKAEVARAVGAQLVFYEELLQQADIVTFHVPATKITRGMFGRQELKHVKADALVVNTSRGTVVDFEAACEAVEAGRLGGFAADVFTTEPCDLSGRAHPRLYFTPHIGGNSVEAVRAMGRAAIGQVRAYISS